MNKTQEENLCRDIRRIAQGIERIARAVERMANPLQVTVESTYDFCTYAEGDEDD